MFVLPVTGNKLERCGEENISPPFVPASVSFEKTILLCHMEKNVKNKEYFKVRKLICLTL
jgi:hypothetical protein